MSKTQRMTDTTIDYAISSYDTITPTGVLRLAREAKRARQREKELGRVQAENALLKKALLEAGQAIDHLRELSKEKIASLQSELKLAQVENERNERNELITRKGWNKAEAKLARQRILITTLVDALKGYHKTAMSIAYAQWSPEMFRAETALSKAKEIEDESA